MIFNTEKPRDGGVKRINVIYPYEMEELNA